MATKINGENKIVHALDGDKEAKDISVSCQAIIKMWIAEKLQSSQ